MNSTFRPARRRVFGGLAAAGLWAACPLVGERGGGLARAQARGPARPVRIVGNQAVENATLWELMREQGYFEAFSIEPTLINAGSPEKTLEAIVNGDGDICMIAGFNGVPSAIEQGAPVKIVGSALRIPNLAVYTAARSDIRSLRDLEGKTVGIGPVNSLLHQTMVALLRKKGVAVEKVKFVVIGSNAMVFKALSSGEVDAGPADVSYTGNLAKLGVRVVEGGEMWSELPEYLYQTAFASNDAIAKKRDTLVGTMAAFARLFRFISTPESKEPYLQARSRVTKGAGMTEGETVWNFFQKQQPYATDLMVTERQIAYRQELNVSMGMQKKTLPFTQITDMSLARDALNLLRG